MTQSHTSTRSDPSRSGAAQSGKDRAADARETGNRSSSGDELSGQARGAVDQAQDQANQLIGQARQQATTQLASQKERAASTLGVLASALHEASRQVREQDDAAVAGYIDSAAGQVDSLAQTLGQQDIAQLLDSAGRYARRQPAVFLAGAIAAGFLGARFLKSSSQGSGGGGSTDGYAAYDGRSESYGDGYGAGYAGGSLDGGGYGDLLTGGEGGLGYGSPGSGLGASASGIDASDLSGAVGSASASGGVRQDRSAFDAGPGGS